MRFSLTKNAPHEAHLYCSVLFLTQMHPRWSIVDSVEPLWTLLSQIRVLVGTGLTVEASTVPGILIKVPGISHLLVYDHPEKIGSSSWNSAQDAVLWIDFWNFCALYQPGWGGGGSVRTRMDSCVPPPRWSALYLPGLISVSYQGVAVYMPNLGSDRVRMVFCVPAWDGLGSVRAGTVSRTPAWHGISQDQDGQLCTSQVWDQWGSGWSAVYQPA